MTQEEKQLLLQDLCARLPYGVIMTNIELPQTHYPLTCGDLHDAMFDDDWDDVPYLRPVSSMTEDEMDRLFDILQIDKDGKDEDWIKINDVYGIKFFFPTGKWIENVVEAYDYLYSIHIDFRGLIHKGLAVEVTEENNPYNN